MRRQIVELHILENYKIGINKFLETLHDIMIKINSASENIQVSVETITEKPVFPTKA